MNVRLPAADKIKLANSDHVFAIMQKVLLRESLLRRTQEHFWILCLAQNNRLLNLELVGLGGLRSVAVDPMEVFSIALQKRASKIIMVHNHPSGDIVPSKEDLNLTDRMIQVGNFLNLPVMDHFIITDRAWLSFADSGLLDELARSKRFVLQYKEQQRMRDEALEFGVKKGRAAGKREGVLEVARRLMANGVAQEVIVAATGLTKAAVVKLAKSAAPRK